MSEARDTQSTTTSSSDAVELDNLAAAEEGAEVRQGDALAEAEAARGEVTIPASAAVEQPDALSDEPDAASLPE